MSDFNWCHGPDCHKKHTVDRVRGVKGSKVLRTKKVTNKYNRSMFGNGGGSIWDFFCNHQCLMDFVSKHTQAMLNIEPRTECQETPIKDPIKEKHTHEFSWGNHSYTTTKLEVDENRQS